MEAWGERGEREHRAKRPGEPAQRHVDELEDKYLRLKEEHMALKKYSHDQDEKIKKMATKLVRLTSDLKKLRGGQPMATDPDVSVSFSAKHRGTCAPRVPRVHVYDSCVRVCMGAPLLLRPARTWARFAGCAVVFLTWRQTAKAAARAADSQRACSAQDAMWKPSK